MTNTRACYSLNAVTAALDTLNKIGDPRITRRAQFNGKCILLNDLLLFCREYISEFVFYADIAEYMNRIAEFPDVFKVPQMNNALYGVYSRISYELKDIYSMIQSGEVDHV